MKIILPAVFDDLKKAVLVRAGLSTVIPSDCLSLASAIFKSTGKRISDTTLKRIYGFAVNTSTPSVFTLDILSQYCGHISWGTFVNQHLEKYAPQLGKEMASISDASQRLTIASKNTLTALQNRSGIPFNLTIQRRLVNEHLDLFISSDEQVTVITAPSGYGKTIALCHWVKSKLDQRTEEGSQKKILFLNGKVLSSVMSEEALMTWLWKFMGLSQDLYQQSLMEKSQPKDDSFYLILDGFDDGVFDTKVSDSFLDILLVLLSKCEQWPGFKLILTMRSDVWARCSERLIAENRMDNWFTGFMNDENPARNMPVFSPAEIKLLSERINPYSKLPDPLSTDVCALFCYPLFFQYYYQKHARDFSLDELNDFKVYEVMDSFFLDKIYGNKFNIENTQILHILLNNGILVSDTFRIDKFKVESLLKGYRNAYQYLIGTGLITEINEDGKSNNDRYIQFANRRLYTACLARKLLVECEGYNEELCLKISKISDVTFRTFVLKWCLFYAIKSRHHEMLKILQHVIIPANEKFVVLRFLSSLIRGYFVVPGKTTSEDKLSDEVSEEMARYFLGVEFISDEYKQLLTGLLEFCTNEEVKMLIHFYLASINLIQLNSEEVEKCIKTLKEWPATSIKSFPFYLLACLETIHLYFKHGQIDKKALSKLTRFLFDYAFDVPAKLDEANDLFYLLALIVVKLTGNPEKLKKTAKKNISRLESCGRDNSPIHFILQYFLAGSYLELGKIESGSLVYNKLLTTFKAHPANFTPLFKSCLELLGMKILSLTGQDEQLEIIIDRTFYSVAPSSYKLLTANMFSIYFQRKTAAHSIDFDKITLLAFKKLINSSSYNARHYLSNYTVISESFPVN